MDDIDRSGAVFAQYFQPEEVLIEPIDRGKKAAEEIAAHGHFAEDILTELEGSSSPTILAMWWEARDAYVSAVRAMVDVNPFESEQEKVRFIRLQSEARRYYDMITWLAAHAAKYRQWRGMEQDEVLQRNMAERDKDARPRE